MRIALRPRTLDTIRRHVAAALAGSFGIAPTANINPEPKFPSMFEPIYSSAFDIAGKGIGYWQGFTPA
jgi:isocitrate/isopropylmalate dehydrogenase